MKIKLAKAWKKRLSHRKLSTNGTYGYWYYYYICWSQNIFTCFSRIRIFVSSNTLYTPFGGWGSCLLKIHFYFLHPSCNMYSFYKVIKIERREVTHLVNIPINMVKLLLCFLKIDVLCSKLLQSHLTFCNPMD